MFDNNLDNDIKIPIIVDSVKDTELCRMTRCTYFTIENSEPAPNWTLRINDMDVGFYMIGLSGVIHSPPGDSQFFDTPEKYNQLFDAIERNGTLYVEMNDIWLPNELFPENSKRLPRRGDVFRIGSDLFNLAYVLKDEANSYEILFDRFNQLDIPQVLVFSEEETQGLLYWNEMQIKVNKGLYHENPETNLPKKEDSQKPLPPLTN
ncbi:MAG: hypothetical protein OEY89_16425 [Gammaproteobacteria bacterium]|nr:hypothetical protein [Gammaproteobacteria bacterium]